MKLFKCQSCQQILYFENTVCEKCGHRLGYLPEAAALSALEADGDDRWRALAAPGRSLPLLRQCRPTMPATGWSMPRRPTGFASACRHNRTIPDVSTVANREAWRKIEIAKHRLFYSLLRWRLPLPTRAEDPAAGSPSISWPSCRSRRPRVMTGHDNGLITIALAEADDVQREKSRVAMHEPYRTLLGHFRHEIGHYFWDRLVADGDRLEAFRALFGDERQDYGEAFNATTPTARRRDWQARFVSAYAAAHPWEDFAETWAHYLHIVDTLEIAAAFGLSTRPSLTPGDELDATVDFDPYRARSMAQLVESWLPLSVALNSLNRAMGQSDLYPFVLSPPAIDKLAFVHDLVHAT